MRNLRLYFSSVFSVAALLLVAVPAAHAYNFFTPTSNMTGDRLNPLVVTLNNGKGLIISGYGGLGYLNTAEVYDTRTEGFTATGTMVSSHRYGGAVTLADGKVLAIGGVESGTYLTKAEIYDPRTRSWTAAGDMPEGRADVMPVLLSALPGP